MPGTQLDIWKLIALAIAPLLGVLAAMLRRKDRPGIQDIVAGLAAGALGVTASLLTVARGRDLFAFLYRTLGRFGAQASVACAVLVVGGVAHLFKQKNQFWYGILEVGFAGGCAVSIASGMSPKEALFSQWVALGGTAYVVARGLNNISEAKRRNASKIPPNPPMQPTGSAGG